MDPSRASFERHALVCLADVTRYAQSLTRNRSDTDDLVQDTFTRALHYWHHYLPTTNCKHWLFAICRNTHYRRWRREQVEERALARAGESAKHEVGWWSSCSRVTDEDAFDVMEHLARALDNLPFHHRRVFELVALDERAYDEAAAILAIPIGTVRSRLSRARRLLRDALLDHREDEEYLRCASGLVCGDGLPAH